MKFYAHVERARGGAMIVHFTEGTDDGLRMNRLLSSCFFHSRDLARAHLQRGGYHLLRAPLVIMCSDAESWLHSKDLGRAARIQT